MRIGIDARLWNESGVGRYTRNLIYQLQKIDKKNSYVLFVKNDFTDEKLEIGNKIWKIVKTNIHWHSLEEQFEFPKILSQENLDLMHFPYFSVPVFYKKSYIVTIHDLIINHFNTGKASTLLYPMYLAKRLGYNYIIKNAVNNSQKIIAVSKATKDEITDHFNIDPEKITVTYEGIDIDLISKSTYGASKVQGSKRKVKDYFLYVGNAYPHKNLDRLIQSFQVCTDQHHDIFLILVGKDDYFYRHLKEKVKKMNLIDKVIFYGEANDQELADLYKNALCLIFPSLMEGFGLPAIEAMANQCLVLASDIPALREICLDVALYFDPLDTSQLSQKMKEIYSNNSSHYGDLIKAGLKRVKMFSWEKMAKETLKVYESCVSL